MATQIELKPILPEKGNWALFEIEIAKTLEQVLEIYENDLRKYTGTWSTQPKWTKKVTKRRAQYVGKIGTNNRKFAWVEDGTKSYWARMDRGFIPKTAHGRLVSTAGRGGKNSLRRSPRYPGIKGRKNLPLIAKRREDDFAAVATVRINLAAQRLFGGRGGFIGFVPT